MKPINNTVIDTPPSGIRRFFDVAAQMEGVVSLGVGEPDFVTPWRIREAAIYSLEKGFTSYTSNAGMPVLREAISDYVERMYDARYRPSDEVIVTVGVSEGLDLALRTIDLAYMPIRDGRPAEGGPARAVARHRAVRPCT